MFLFSSISSLWWKHKPDGISITHMKLTFYTNPLENSPNQRTGEQPQDTRIGEYIQIVYHILKKKFSAKLSWKTSHLLVKL